MHRHLSLGLITLVMLGTTLASADIVAVQENGKTVYVDGPDSPKGDAAVQSVPGPAKIYLYYSKSEHRWKRVPPATAGSMRKARSAAADVQQYLAWRAQQPAFRVNYGESRPETPVKPAAPLPASNQQSSSSSSGPATQASGALSAEQLDAIIEEAAAKHGVDSNLVRAVIKVESNYNPHAISRKGAMGLMQLMPSTARSLQVNPFDARQNIDGGVRHLKQLLQDFNGDLTKSVAAYNAGAGAVQRHGGVPPYAETQAYVRRVNQLYNGDQPLKPAGSEIRSYRDKFGVLTFTNQ